METPELDGVSNLIFEWNDLKQPIPPICVHDLVSEQAKRTPNSLAVTYEKYNEGLTYAELDNLSNQVASKLIEMKIKPQELVGLCVARSVEMVVSILGIMKAGGAYVALDPQFPRDRLIFMIEDASIKIILTTSDLFPFAHSLASNPQSTQFLFVDNLKTHSSHSSDINNLNLLPKVQPNHLAYALYTSGSTGKSKGVLLEHKGVVNFLLSMIKIPGFTSKDVVMACTTICFDISILEIFCPLIVGGTCIIVGEDTRRYGEKLVSLIDNLPITVLQATPSLWKLLLEFNWKGKKGFRALCGGEPLSISLGNRLFLIVDELWNMYGPTEATVWCTLEKITQPLTSLPSIGKPIHNNYCYILNPETLQPVPIGKEGELYIGGVQLARGYHNRPELTAERFIPNPFLPNERIYKTGDLAKYIEDGRIMCLGRADLQVKIHGYRVELGEIESILDQHPSIKENIVSTYEVAEDLELVAYIILKPEQTLTENELQLYLRTVLPFYMIPSFFIYLESLPLLPNGKINRKALPQPIFSLDKSNLSQGEVLDEYEKKLIEICQNLLTISHISKKDNLFSIGGNSLFAIRLRNAIQNEFKMDISTSEILLTKTIEEIALKMAHIEDHRKSQELCEFISMTHGPGIPIYFIHPAGGFIFPYFRFTQLFEGCVPTIGIQDLSIQKKVITQISKKVESMAQVYINKLLEINPHGPFRLAGWSLGFFISLEMAQKLKALGKHVEIVINFDQSPCEKYSKLDFWMDSFLMSAHLLKDSFILRSNSRFKMKSGFMKKFWKIFNTVITRPGDDFLNHLVNSGMISDASTRKLVKLLECHRKALSSYVPSSYDGKVIVFQSAQNKKNLEKLWSKLLPNATYYIVPGNHYNIFYYPNNHEIEKIIKNVLHIHV